MTRDTVVVINPASGPGSAPDPNYIAALRHALPAGIQPYGYVDTAYGARPPDVVRTEALEYRSLYGVAGIFLDQVAAGQDLLGYYEALSATLHSLGFAVAINPGQPDIDPRYLATGEHVVTFEGTYDQYLLQRFPPWTGHVSPEKTWHLIYGAASAREMRHALRLAGERHASRVYVTNGSMPNPWDRLPPYWSEQQQLLSRC